MKFKWASHRCLLEGVQGVTLRIHRLGSRLVLCGGATATGQPNLQLSFCPLKNPTRWARLSGRLPQYYSASVVIDDRLVLIGGYDSSTNACTKQLVSYNFDGKTWQPLAHQMPTARSAASAVACGDYVAVIGGISSTQQFLDTVELLHLPSGQWITAISLPKPTAGASVVLFRRRVFVIGGSSKEGISRAVYSTPLDRLVTTTGRFSRLTLNSSSVWTRHEDVPYGMMSTCIFRDNLLVMGGIERTASLSQPAQWVWCYCPVEERNHWTVIQKMHTGRKMCCVTSLSHSQFLVLGGSPYFSVVDVASVSPGSTSSR